MHGGFAGQGCCPETTASLQLFRQRLLPTCRPWLEKHEHERWRESTAVPQPVEHDPTREHWQVYVVQIGNTGHGCCVDGQMRPQLAVAVSWRTPLVVA